MVATQTALLEASKQEAAALDLVLRVQASLAANKQMSKAEKAEITKGLLPIVARLQLKVRLATRFRDMSNCKQTIRVPI